MDGFASEIHSFHREFNKERCVIVPIMAVNTGTLAEIKNDCAGITYAMAQLCRFVYASASPPADFEVPLQDIRLMSLADGLRVFEKPGHKDRYCHLMSFLAGEAGLFAEIAYLTLVSRELSDDDQARFIFVTLPSTFNFFLCQADRTCAFQFVRRVLDLHCYLHGFELSQAHVFLPELVFSFFVTTKPVRFFEMALRPLLPLLLPRCLMQKDQKYTKCGDGLHRFSLWQILADFISRLLDRMISSLPLLPPAALDLIQHVAKVGPDNPTVRYFFIFDFMFVGYIRRFSGCERPEIIGDVVQVLRCFYPQTDFPSKLYPTVGPIIERDRSFMLFIDRLLRNRPIPDSELTTALS
jgi:hypothetical protein